MPARPGEKIAILMPASAMSAVAMGTHTPSVIRSISTLVPKSNMTSASSNTRPNVFATVTMMSSNNDPSPAHSPRGPPSSRRPIEIFERISGMIATLAKMFSTSLPRPRRARPRIQCPIINNKSFSEGVEILFSSFSSDCSSSFRESCWSCNLLSVCSVQYESDKMVSDSKRRIRGANFIRNCARSESSSREVLMEGRAFDDGSLPKTTLLAVMAATVSVLACNSCTRNNVVWAHRSSNEM
mmetsp:Transcript_13191/g.37099  ORF Transcript_13191/g.37099 Transcript_13191/m.37099 type:complete len:241 (+) Transcript_13191:1696-2418(+)